MARTIVIFILLTVWGLLLPARADATEANRVSDQENRASLFEAAQLHERGTGVARDDTKAADLYCRAARLGDREAAVRLAFMYANGRGVTQDDGIAVALFRHANDVQAQPAQPPSRLIAPESIRLPDCMKRDAARVRPIVRASAGAASSAVSTSLRIDASAEVTAAIREWTAAWSARDVEKYFAAYAPGFRLPAGKSRAAWEAERRERILGKTQIAVAAEKIQITVSGEKANAQFVQNYRADNLAQTNSKVLSLVKVNGRWLIQEEASGAPKLATR